MSERCTIITMEVDVINIQSSLNKVYYLAASQHGAYVCVSNVHMCMEAFDSEDFQTIVNNADLVIPDGRPLSWAQKLLGYDVAEQVRGQDIMNSICEYSGIKNFKIGFYGGSSDALLRKVVDQLKNSYSDINIKFMYSPPFRSLTVEEDDELVRRVNESGINILFVGTGCPKQERWMSEHKNKFSCVMIGVGAAFDFIAGSKRHAPRWMQKMGLEWLFRLVSEPKRLWKRYLRQNPRFIYYFSKQLIKHHFGSNRIK